MKTIIVLCCLLPTVLWAKNEACFKQAQNLALASFKKDAPVTAVDAYASHFARPRPGIYQVSVVGLNPMEWEGQLLYQVSFRAGCRPLKVELLSANAPE